MNCVCVTTSSNVISRFLYWTVSPTVAGTGVGVSVGRGVSVGFGVDVDVDVGVRVRVGAAVCVWTFAFTAVAVSCAAEGAQPASKTTSKMIYNAFMFDFLYGISFLRISPRP